MPSRRIFLRQSSVFTAGLCLCPGLGLRKEDRMGLQLYTVRKELAKGVEGTLARIARIGYPAVEVFGYERGAFFGYTPQAFAILLKAHHLKAPSGHYMMTEYLTTGAPDELKPIIAAAVTMGHRYLVVPYLPPSMRTGLDDYKRLADKLNRAGEAARAAGLQLLYHNHNFEFKDWGEGQTGFAILAKDTDPSLLAFELDIYWAVRAGLDPVAFVQSHPGRIKLWHVKDLAVKAMPSFTNEGNQPFTEVGTGVIDYATLFKQASAGLDYFFVEQDETIRPVYESIAISLHNTRKFAGFR